jgi:hypothetical protein
MIDKQESNDYITHMITKVIPTKRTENTYRIVFQRFEPTKEQYRDIASFRIESTAGIPVLSKKFAKAITAEFGEGDQ